ncbi:hypothetical protein [Candidatus Mesenet endosymbiont of Agriotes lineatus]|uniref:hypothetical protein n=1 Tax=Candidatus Mesenet endosymbiont of Agriotes lineatus TaxID=3077948 RepID=UPI0030CDA5AA
MKYDPNDLPRYTSDEARQLNINISYSTKVKLFDEHGQEIGMLSNNFHNYKDKIFFSVDYNYSYTDFLASVAPQVNTEDKFDKELGKWTKVITFDQGKGDIGGTDRGYTDYQKIYTPENQKSQSNDEQMQGDQPAAYAKSSGAREKRTADRDDYSSKQNPVDNNAIQPEAQKPIVLNFIIERGEPIDEYYFSVRIKLTEESKNFLREALGQDVEFNNVDGYLDLDPKTFYIGNGHNNRNELYVRDSGGSVLVGNLPVDNRVLSVEVSPDGSEIVDHGFHYSAVIRNPDSYSKDYKEQNKYPSGLDSDKFLEDVKNTLLSHNGNDIEQKNIFTQVSNNIAEKEDRAVEEQKQVEKEFSKKNVEFKNTIDKGDIVIYRVREKANPDDDERSFAILKMTKKSQKALGIRDEDDKGVKLDTNKLHITELQDSSHKGKYMVKDGIDHVPYNNLFYVLDKNDPSKSGFYHLDQDKFKSPAKYLDAKLQYISDDGLHNKLISNLDKVGQKYAYYNEQMQGDQPQASHKVDKHHAKHEDIVLKDTILSVGKGEEVTLPNGQKIYKAEIKIKYEDIKSLYDQASSEEKQYVLKFWHALDKNNYKIGDLSQEQYYFKGNKFIIKNKNGIELSRDEGKISLQLMHLKDHQGKDHLELVVLNKANGKVIGNIHEIDDLSYGLLRSDSDILSHLEIQGHDITVHSSDYNTYLTHGLDNHVLGNHHHGDHTFI